MAVDSSHSPYFHCNVTLYCPDLHLSFSPRDDLFPYILQHFPVLIFTLCFQGGSEVDQKSLKLVQVLALPIIGVIMDELLNNSKNNLSKAKYKPDTGHSHISHTILHIKSENNGDLKGVKKCAQSYIARGWRGWDSNPDPSIPRTYPILFN